MDPMEIDDSLYIKRNLTMEGFVHKVDFPRKNPPSRCFRVCVGLTCALLLAGNIGQFVYYEIISSAQSTQLQSNNISKEEVARLQKWHNETQQDLQTKFRQLKTENVNLKTEGDKSKRDFQQLQADFSTLTTEKEHLQRGYSALDISKKQLQGNYDSLQQAKQLLQTSYDDLIVQKEQLQSNYQNLEKENSKSKVASQQLQGDLSTLKAEKEQLQSSYSTLSNSKDQLQSNYVALNKEKESLHKLYNSMKQSYDSVVTVKDQLQKKINRARKNIVCQNSWKKFDIGCYFISTSAKNWNESREFCVASGGDLLVVDSQEEQAFVNKWLKSNQNAWIGLSDIETEGTWKWLDGTVATTTYWQHGQPNSYGGNQDCGEILQDTAGVGQWNDDSCTASQTWICEK